MKLDKNTLNWLQVDLTARCQASCLECSRNYKGEELNPKMGKAHTWDLPLEILQKAITPEMLKNNLNKILFNGNFGDPCIHPDFIEHAKYIVDNAHKKLQFRISTNGAMFNNEYWKKLAQILKPLKYHQIIFAIDGLSDTHSIYRRGTKYEDVIDHAKTFIDNGGNATWQFIVFDHNKHQREEAREISKTMGFTEIIFRGDEVHDEDNAKGESSASARLYTRSIDDDLTITGNKTKKHKEVSVSKKQSAKGLNIVNKQLEEVKKSYETTQNFLDYGKISCQYYNTKGLYIEYDGTVWMCCWTGDMHKKYNPIEPRSLTTKNWEHIENKFGKDFNNLYNHSFDDILNHEFFASYLDKTFNSTRKDPNTPRLETCAKTCVWGKKFV